MEPRIRPHPQWRPARLGFPKDPLQGWILVVQSPHYFFFRVLLLEAKNHKLPGLIITIERGRFVRMSRSANLLRMHPASSGRSIISMGQCGLHHSWGGM
jgi:hypothetical protein